MILKNFSSLGENTVISDETRVIQNDPDTKFKSFKQKSYSFPEWKFYIHQCQILEPYLSPFSVLKAFCIQVLGCLVSEKTKTLNRKCLTYYEIALSCVDLPVRQSLPRTYNCCYRHWPYLPLFHLNFACPQNWKF